MNIISSEKMYLIYFFIFYYKLRNINLHLFKEYTMTLISKGSKIKSIIAQKFLPLFMKQCGDINIFTVNIETLFLIYSIF